MKTKFLFIALPLLLACSQEELQKQTQATKETAASAKEKAREKLSGLADVAKDKTNEAIDVTKDKAGELAEASKNVASSAKDLLSSFQSATPAAVETLKTIKTEFNKVYQNNTDYDVVVSSAAADDAAMKVHEATVAGLPSIEVSGIKVAYQEQNTNSLNGVTYQKHFAATWVYNGKKYGLSYYSKENIDAKAFVALLEKLVPVVQNYVK